MGDLFRGIPVTLLTLSNAQARTWESATVDNVLVAPYAESDGVSAQQPQGHQATYHLAIPKGDAHRWEGALVQFFGETWAVVGKPVQGIGALIPGGWNKKALCASYCTGTLDPAGLWADTVTLVRIAIQKDADGYDSGTAEESSAVGAIFLQGVNAAATEADKTGFRRSAKAELWEQDYDGEPFVRHGGVLYSVKSAAQTGRGTLLLALEEVWQ